MGARHSDLRALDEAVGILADHKEAWTRLLIPDRIALLRQCLAETVRSAGDVVTAGCTAKGLDPQSPASGEEWMSGPVPVIRNLRLLVESLSRIHRDGYLAIPAADVRRTPTGELAVQVFPGDSFDRLMYPGTRMDVWMQPEIDETSLPGSVASAYRADRRPEGRVALVLGAGNVASIGPMDLLYKLFVENQAVVLKMHPVNDYLGPLVERAFRPLIDAGYLRVVYGDAAEGQYLIHHAAVDEVHMTGSTTVHDRIVWGDTPEEQALRRAAATPKVTKRITSELGCVTPTIVVPGRWSDDEIQYQAENVATMVAHSASCTCTSAKLIVTWRGWPQRRAFLDRIAETLSRYPARLAYYPGAAARYASFMDAYPQSHRLASASGNTLASATIYDIDPAVARDLAFREESWSPVLAETCLDAGDEAEFLSGAVRFCNERIFGTLSAGLIVQPATRAQLGSHVDRAVAELRYGTVAVNHWSAVSFGLAVAPWGAYPGHTLEEIVSGIGVVHNTLMFDRPLKSVLWGPFTASPTPAWFVTHRRSHIVGRRMVAFEASPSWWQLPALALAAARP
jgi:acyl-CoA reductase-like NAD-dependent aldehyde dehydrogenase